MYINIHSHGGGDGMVIQNYHSRFAGIPATGHYSAGLHPWYITTAWELEMEDLKKAAAQQQVVAIGECGLDKVCRTDFALQQTVFTAQIQLANALGKPLIIHCVKAFDEVLQLLQQHTNKVPVIFHGFNKSKALALQLTGKGYYLSFGKALLLPHMQQVIAALPHDKLFLETDDAALAIQTVYNSAAAALQIDVNALSLQLQKNAAGVFGFSF